MTDNLALQRFGRSSVEPRRRFCISAAAAVSTDGRRIACRVAWGVISASSRARCGASERDCVRRSIGGTYSGRKLLGWTPRLGLCLPRKTNLSQRRLQSS